MPKFDDDENKRLDKSIKLIAREMTEKVKECEQLVKQLSFEEASSASEEQGNKNKNNLKQ